MVESFSIEADERLFLLRGFVGDDPSQFVWNYFDCEECWEGRNLRLLFGAGLHGKVKEHLI